jgi:chromosome partitioning protein
MKTIVLASQKGGAGKTTLAGHLAVAAEAAGAGPVALIDTDPQAGLAAWWNSRKAETPGFAAIKGTLAETLAGLAAAGTALVVVDTPPILGDAIAATMAQADLVVIPVQPSPHDLRAAGATVELARRTRRPMVFVVNRARARTRLTVDAALALSQHAPVAPMLIEDRQDFRTAMIDGRTAAELDRESKAAIEMARLWTYLAERLEDTQHG